VVNLPDEEGGPLACATGPSAWAREVLEEANRPNPVRRLHMTRLSWREDGNGLEGEIELIDDIGIIYKTASFHPPARFNPRQRTEYTQEGAEVRVRCEDGTNFHVRIAETRRENPMTGVARRMSEPVTTGGYYNVPESPYPQPAYQAMSEEGLRHARDQLRAHGYGNVFEQDMYGAWETKKTIKLPKNMKCAFCNDKIHSPDKLIELLGEEGTKDYLKYCKKKREKPQLFCCGCYSFIEDKPKIYGALNRLNRQLKKFTDVNQREKELKIREKELDKQLKSLHKKK